MPASIYMAVAERVENYIRERHLTGRLPGRLRLARELGVHHVTLGKAMEVLTARGLLTVRGTSGTYVRGSADTERRCFHTLGVVGMADEPGPGRALFSQLSVRAKAGGYSLIGITFNEDLFRENRRILLNFPVDGFLFRGSSLRREQLEILRNEQIPFAVASSLLRRYCDTVEIDHVAIYRRILSSLREKGYRRIAFLEFDRVPEYRAYLERIRQVWQEEQEADFDAELFYAEGNSGRYWARYGASFREVYFRKALKHWAQAGKTPDAVVSPLLHFVKSSADFPPCICVCGEEESVALEKPQVYFPEHARLGRLLSLLMERCDGYDGPFRHEVMSPERFNLDNLPIIKERIFK